MQTQHCIMCNWLVMLLVSMNPATLLLEPGGHGNPVHLLAVVILVNQNYIASFRIITELIRSEKYKVQCPILINSKQ